MCTVEAELRARIAELEAYAVRHEEYVVELRTALEDRHARHDHAAADAMRLRADNTQLLAENGRLRREVETANRKAKR